MLASPRNKRNSIVYFIYISGNEYYTIYFINARRALVSYRFDPLPTIKLFRFLVIKIFILGRSRTDNFSARPHKILHEIKMRKLFSSYLVQSSILSNRNKVYENTTNALKIISIFEIIDNFLRDCVMDSSSGRGIRAEFEFQSSALQSLMRKYYLFSPLPDMG